MDSFRNDRTSPPHRHTNNSLYASLLSGDDGRGIVVGRNRIFGSYIIIVHPNARSHASYKIPLQTRVCDCPHWISDGKNMNISYTHADHRHRCHRRRGQGKWHCSQQQSGMSTAPEEAAREITAWTRFFITKSIPLRYTEN